MPPDPVVIAGGGPVGLFLAICLLRQGIPCRVLERRERPVTESRSIGVHPVALELLGRLGLADAFVANGVRLRGGIAHDGRREIGRISFATCPKPYDFVLIHPQRDTERLLRQCLRGLDGDALVSGADVVALRQETDRVWVGYRQDAKEGEIAAAWLVACDGSRGRLAQMAGIPRRIKRYPDTYIMGDCRDREGPGDQAVIYLPRDGLVESFPLPGGWRRWVVRTTRAVPSPDAGLLAALVRERTGRRIDEDSARALSGFGVQYCRADVLWRGRVLLAGDAAHVISPIGGQGMNLGWLGAWRLAEALAACKAVPSAPAARLQHYSARQRAVAARAARRAELNMLLGRRLPCQPLKNLMVKGILMPPVSRLTARLFTMRGLEQE